MSIIVASHHQNILIILLLVNLKEHVALLPCFQILNMNPTIHTLLFNLNIPGIEVLLTKEFKLKQYSNNDIVEFDKLEQQWNRTHQPHNLLQNFKNKQSNAHITIGGITYHKQQIEKPEAN
ncbi:hypothetical protein C9374_011129 [Naegleria lovaniensis]|uniref:Uncharacterized protein n=1 Tax=Naegleria lovaniensis TaxID=51637 RepID=A0AA88GEM3_NAELO|nr:uncharacterized protein C9374_012084 [Naegleria lovaniensis]XP_044543224.1 uncharacterized protein C9374_011129 [Naegleria lovaniensis]KAG2373477.1 hypothetical protein C9374_012084 [Naegleria lovaniensis]KAG2374050.1 hypothetical protein C9374_011129 [Naegleria lovaniensis]